MAPSWTFAHDLALACPASGASITTAFVEGNLPSIVKGLKAQMRDFEGLDARIQDSIARLPGALKDVEERYQQRVESRDEILRSVIDVAKELREKVDTFNERIDGSLKDALAFNHLVRRQQDHPANVLPMEVGGNSGVVVADLQRASSLGHRVLAKNADDLVRVAKDVRLMNSAIAAPVVTSELLVSRLYHGLGDGLSSPASALDACDAAAGNWRRGERRLHPETCPRELRRRSSLLAFL